VIPRAARQAVVKNPCASTVVTLGLVLSILTWGAAQLGIDLPGWLAILIGSGLLAGALAYPGIDGIWRFIRYGHDGPEGPPGADS
jgi:hypothetical protein